MSHTKEPWQVYPGRTNRKNIVIENIHGDCVALVMESEDVDEADARRIVACVNACAGVPTKVLEAVGRHHGFDPAEVIAEIEKQRDELLAALKLVLPMAKGYAAEHQFGKNDEHCMAAVSAIARAESTS